jgi:hypothetical protein
MKNHNIVSRTFRAYGNLSSIVIYVAIASFAAVAWGQQQQEPPSYTPSTLIDQAKSRAEKEADQLVSLSPDKITEILREEPGLLLEVKKALVRKAFDRMTRSSA